MNYELGNSDGISRSNSRRSLALAGLTWAVLTVIALAFIAYTYSVGGLPGLLQFAQSSTTPVYIVSPASPSTYDIGGSFKRPEFTYLSVMICWLLLGSGLILLYYRRISSRNVLTWLGFFCVSFLYVNILRERFSYGDIGDYIQAAKNLFNGVPLNPRYLYPPLWATILKPLVPLGDGAIFDFCWILNFLSLFGFYFIVHRTLEQYGLPGHLAAIVSTLFILVNVPILRTLCYVQVNLHVMNLILLSLLCYPKSRFLSALSLSLAVHLKVSPMLLVLAFLLNRDFRWLFWFSTCFLLVMLGTIVANGLLPYGEFLSNLSNIFMAKEVSFHDNSIDSFFKGLSRFVNVDLQQIPYFIAMAKILIGGAGLFVLSQCVRKQAFLRRNGYETLVYNAFPVLLILMILASPITWEYHGVFLALSFLVIFLCLSTFSQLLWYGFAYTLQFLTPTFDFFPWSYGRLLSALVLLGLAWSASRISRSPNILSELQDLVATATPRSSRHWPS